MTEQLSHGFFIVAAYGVTITVIGSVFLWLVFTGRSRRARIASLTTHSGTMQPGSSDAELHDAG